MPRYSHDGRLPEPQQQAIDWLVRLRSDDICDDELCEFADWLARDPAHSKAFADAETLFADMALAAEIGPPHRDAGRAESGRPEFSAPSVRQHRPRRVYASRAFIPLLAAAAVFWFAISLYLPQQSNPLRLVFSDYHTRPGEIKAVELSDGSAIVLDTSSALSVDYQASQRLVYLHQGRAQFTVAADYARPFTVIAGKAHVRALGTSFQVYRTDGGAVDVVVSEHSVAVRNGQDPGQPTGDGVEVAAGERLTFAPGSPLPTPAAANPEQSAAWQQRKLIVNDRPLAELTAELARYRNGRIFIGDERLNRLRVSGVFSLADPEKAIHTVARALDLKETWIGPWWVVLGRQGAR